jgi:hypothetical protein
MWRFLAAAALAAALVACGSDDDDSFQAPDGGESFAYLPVVTTSELVVGSNRFAFQLLDENSQNVEDATITLRTAFVEGSEDALSDGVQARYLPLELESLGSEVTHEHGDGSLHIHSVPFGSGLYVAGLTFDEPGEWGIEFRIERDGDIEDVPLVVTVLEDGSTPGPGDAAPRTQNYTLADKPVEELSSDAEPDLSLYETTVVAAVWAGQPSVVAFATSAFCHSRVCGPVLEVVKEVKAGHPDVAFIHIEPFENLTDPEHLRDSPFAAEWNLPNEPWVFVIDGAGVVRAAFEGPLTVDELEEAVASAAEPD